MTRLFLNKAVTLVLLLLSVGAVSAQAPTGLSDVQNRFTSLPAGASLRIIAQVNVDPGRVNAVGKPNATTEAAGAAIQSLQQLGASSIRRVGGTDFIAMSVTQNQLNQIIALGIIRSVYPDKLNAPLLPTLEPAIGGTIIHQNNANGLGMTVAVLDTGIDNQHPFFAGRIALEACYSTNDSTQGASSLCPGGAASASGPGSAAPCANLCDHGTHVAGIAASGDTTVRGLAPSAQIVAIKVFSLFNSAASCSPNPSPCVRAFDTDIYDGLAYIRDVLSAQYSITAVNLSLGGGSFSQPCPSDFLAGIVQDLHGLGIAVVAAAGNDANTSGIASPACIPSAIAVGSVDNTATPNSVSGFSNSSSLVTVLAPGGGVQSSIPGTPEGRTAIYYGTSMATPVVVGTIAALRSKFFASVDTIKDALVSTGVLVTDARNNITKPRVNDSAAYDALQAMAPSAARIWMHRTWSDTGLANDPTLASQNLSQAPSIWVRNNADGPQFPNRYQMQNPIYNQPNYIDVEVLNSGKIQGQGTLSIYVSHASPNPNDASAWIKLVDKDLTIPPLTSAFYEYPWTTVPAPGHYCLLAKWTDSGGNTTIQFTDIRAAILASPGDLIWHNINVVPGTGSATIEWRKTTLSNDQNLVVEIVGFQRAAGGHVAVRLPNTVANLLRDEPTLANAKIQNEGDYVIVTMELKDGVYYFPLPDSAPDKIVLPIDFVKGDAPNMAGGRVDILQVKGISEHKQTGAGIIGHVVYQIQ